MNTQYNKAVVGVVSGLATILAMFGIDLGLDDKLIASIGAVVTPILVLLVPNKQA